MTNPDPVEMLWTRSALPDAVSAPALHRARRATRAQFVALGVLSGFWGAHIPSVKQFYALTDTGLSTVLLAAAAGAVSSLLLAGRVVGKLGARNAAKVAGVAMCLLIGAVLHWPCHGVLLLGAMAMGASMSLFDVAINTEGSALEALGRQPIMSGLHGNFSLGGMAGAFMAGLLIQRGWESSTQLYAAAALTATRVLWTSSGMLATHPSATQSADEPHGWTLNRALMALGLLIFLGMTAEGVLYDWSVLYLKQEVAMTQDRAAMGYALFCGAMAATRLLGDRLRLRFTEKALLQAGAGLAGVAMALVLAARTPWVAYPGLTLVGAGLALVVPILYNAATKVPGVPRASAIATVSSIGYVGFVLGPPVIGHLAEMFSLSHALALVVVSSWVLTWGARKITPLRAD